MKRPQFLLLLQLLFIHSLSGLERAEPIEAKIGQIYKINFESNDLPTSIQLEEVAFYQFHIAQKIEKEDIIIIMTGERDFVHSPYLFMSSDNKYPDGNQRFDRSCGMQGVNICSIPQSEIQDNTTFYLGIFCKSNCKLEFRINYYLEKIFNVGDSYVFNFDDGDDTGLDFKLVVPATDMTEILVEVLLLNVQYVDFGIQLIGQQGNNVPGQQENQFKIYDTWGDGKAVKISKQSGWNPKVESNFTFLIVAGQNSSVQVNIEGYKEYKRAYLGEQIKDILFYGETVNYQIELSNWTLEAIREGKYDLSFDLEPYNGIPDLYINAGFPPEQTSDADWKLNDLNQFSLTDKREGIACLTISNDELLKKMENSTMLYLTVFAETGTSFTLLPYISDYYDRALQFNTIENGYLENGDLITYQLKMNQQKSNIITINLQSIKGTVFLYVKECIDLIRDAQCEINREEILQPQEKNTLFIRFEQKQSRVNFQYNKTECDVVRCQYTIGVYAPKTNTTIENTTIENHYKLIATHQYTRINLKEHQNHFSHVQSQEKEYYQFLLLDNDESVEKIHIIVTRLTGQINVTVSRKQKYPIITDNDFFGNYEINMYQFTRQQGDIQGYYYIGIESLVTSSYNIRVKVYRRQEDGSLKSKSKKLYFGIVEQGILNQEHVDSFYFNMNSRFSKIFFYYSAYDLKSNQKAEITEFPTVKLYHKSKEGQISETVVKREFYSDFLILFELYGNGKEEIQFIELTLTQTDIYIKFSLSVNIHDLFQLIPDVLYTNGLDSGQINKFEIFLEEPSLLYFELFECFGQMQIKGSKTYEDLEYKRYNINQQSPKKISGHTIYKYPLEKPGSFFFSVITQKDAGQYVKSKNYSKESMYMMIPHVMKPNQETPHDIFYAHNGGRMSYEIKGDELIITARQIQAGYENLAQLPFPQPMVYNYKAHLTDHIRYLNFFSKCYLDKYYLSYYDVNISNVYYDSQEIDIQRDQYNKKSNLTFVFNGLELGKLYHVQITVDVVIQMENHNQSSPEPFYFLYYPLLIKFGDKPQDGEYFQDGEQNAELLIENKILGFAEPLFYMIVGGIFAGTIVFVALTMFFIRYRRGHQLLPPEQYEIELPGASIEESKEVDRQNQYQIE